MLSQKQWEFLKEAYNIVSVIKEAMIDAMFERWEKVYNKIFSDELDQNNSPENRVMAHMRTT